MKLPNFDELLRLAKEDPEALERLREDHIAHIIDNCPEQNKQRLRGLQFQIDAIRKTHTPMGACLKISKMMHDKLFELREAAGVDHTYFKHEPAKEVESAKVIDFKSKH